MDDMKTESRSPTKFPRPSVPQIYMADDGDLEKGPTCPESCVAQFYMCSPRVLCSPLQYGNMYRLQITDQRQKVNSGPRHWKFKSLYASSPPWPPCPDFLVARERDHYFLH